MPLCALRTASAIVKLLRTIFESSDLGRLSRGTPTFRDNESTGLVVKGQRILSATRFRYPIFFGVLIRSSLSNYMQGSMLMTETMEHSRNSRLLIKSLIPSYYSRRN